MTQVPLFLTPRQAAERLTNAGLSITEDTVRRWARKGQIERVQLPGGEYRIHRDVVDGLLASTTVPAA
ncbi:excisionase family DNA-binding protein [Micromonospora haikouensis]|uniref:excisionase family DNA-binding protein n=1 Tax=Micromonospora haikouensis TaxID=686309 RepID=UPI003D76286C